MNEKRLLVAFFGVAVASVVVFVAYRFVAALTVSVFLYYSTRRFYKYLGKLRLPKRVRAATVISFVALPLVLLLSYTVVLVVSEVRSFVSEYPVVDIAAANVQWFDGMGELPELTAAGLFNAYQSGQLDPFIDFATENAAFLTETLSSFLLNLLIVMVVTYYLLVDGDRIRGWLLRFDDDAIVREYLEAVDRELEAVLFGNLLNVIAVSIIAIVVYTGYNAFAPVGARIPYPALAGALTGIASLIPVVGMKVVYVPVGGIAAMPSVMGSNPELIVYVLGFLVLAVVVVDTIPDLILRPYLSGETTHVGLLMLAYIFGPVVFGFYGLFLAPILLVVGLTFADTALPRLLGVDPDEGLPRGQMQLDDF